MRPGLPGLTKSVLRGWLVILRGVGGALLFLASIAAATSAVVLPMWLLATRLKRVFTALVVAGFLAGLTALTVAGVRRQARRDGGTRAWLARRLGPAAARVGVAVALFAAAYDLLLLVASGRPFLALPAGLAIAVLAGLWSARRRREPHGDGRSPADDRGDGPSL